MAWTTTDIIYISFEVITSIITIIGNVVVLVAIVRTRQLHSVTNVFIGNLAIADIFVGIFVAPLAGVSYLGLPRNVYGCIFNNSAILIFTNVSILMLLGTAVERFIAIRMPFVYDRILTIRRALLINGGIWILGIVLGLIPMYGWNKAPDEIERCSFETVISLEYMVYFQFFGLVLLPISIMLCIYSYILCVIRKHTRRNASLQNMFTADRRSQRKWKKDVRAAKYFALLILLFAVMWLPINILNTIKVFSPASQAPIEMYLVAIVMSHANSSINPFLYAASNSRIKNSIKVLFHMKQSSENSSTDIPSGINSLASRVPTVHPNNTNKPITTVCGDKNVTIREHLRTPYWHDPFEERSNNPSQMEAPELKQLVPTSLILENGGNTEAFKLSDQCLHSDSTSTNQGTTACFGEDVERPHGSVIGHSSDLSSGRLNTKSADQREYYINLPLRYDEEEHCDSYDIESMTRKHMPSTSPATQNQALGHANFGYVEDTDSGDDILMPSFSGYNCVTQSVHKEFNSGNTSAPECLNDDMTNFRMERDYSIKDSLGNEITPQAMTFLDTVVISPGALEEDNILRQESRRSCTPKRDMDLFKMEDEPADEQEFGKIIAVASDSEVNESDAKGDSTVDTRITHSYFQCQKNANRSNNMTNVEMNTNGLIFINTESEQTKL